MSPTRSGRRWGPGVARLRKDSHRANRSKGWKSWCLAASRKGGNQQNTVAFLERAGLGGEKADVFLIEIDVEKLADLALFVADVARKFGEAGSKLVQRFGDGGRATVDFRRGVGEAAEGGGDFNCDGHFYFSLSSFNLCLRTCRCGAELRIEVRLEGVEARRDGFAGRKFGGDGVGGFKPVAGDAHHRGFVRLDAILTDEFLRDAHGYAAGGFREDALGFGKELDGGDDLRIGDVLRPAAGFANLLYGKGTVGGIADGERARNGVGLLRLQASQVWLHAIGNRRAAAGLGAGVFYTSGPRPPPSDQIVH